MSSNSSDKSIGGQSLLKSLTFNGLESIKEWPPKMKKVDSNNTTLLGGLNLDVVREKVWKSINSGSWRRSKWVKKWKPWNEMS